MSRQHVAACAALCLALHGATSWADVVPCARADEEVARVTELRSAAPAGAERLADLEARRRLTALNARCPSPWVALHLGLTSFTLGDHAAARAEIEGALGAGDPRVEALRGDLERGPLAALRRERAQPSPALQRSPPPPLRAGVGALRVTGIVLAGAGLTAAIAGVVFGVRSADSARQIERACDANGSEDQASLCGAIPRGDVARGVTGGTACGYAQQGSAGGALCDRNDAEATLGLALGVGGGVMIAAGVTLALVAPRLSRAPVALSLGPGPDGGAALLAVGRF